MMFPMLPVVGAVITVSLAAAPLAKAKTCEDVLAFAGMLCVAGGEPFLIDTEVASLDDYRACVKEKVCPPLAAKASLADATPEQRHRYCIWSGKRLPTEEEQKQAAGKVSGDGLRCATTASSLYRSPFWHAARRPAPGPLEPPTPEQLAEFQNIRHDDAVKEIGTCNKGGHAEHHCRDPMSYISSNEGLRGLFARYISNLGGGYVGLGADQAYDFIAQAKSRWAWLFDYDPAVVAVHQIVHAVIVHCATPEEFAAAYDEANEERTRRWVRRALRDHPDEIRPTLRTFAAFREALHEHYTASVGRKRDAFPGFGWLANPKHYRYIRTMVKQGRVLVRRGNLLTDVVLPDIARSARALGVPIRVYYDSNAPDQWTLTDQYRQNVAGLPFDEQSVALRTLLAEHLGLELDGGKWIFVVHGARHLQRALRIEKPEQVRDLMTDALPTRASRLKIIGLPQADPPTENAVSGQRKRPPTVGARDG